MRSARDWLAKGLIGLLHAAQPGPSDAGFTRLVYWFTSSTRLRACKRCLSARLWRNEQIGRFLGTRLRWCKRERMGKRADTENHFCVRHASNQTASQLDLYSCIHKPIKRLWYLTSLATAGLHAACEPGCAHPQTNQPPKLREFAAGGLGEQIQSSFVSWIGSTSRHESCLQSN